MFIKSHWFMNTLVEMSTFKNSNSIHVGILMYEKCLLITELVALLFTLKAFLSSLIQPIRSLFRELVTFFKIYE